MTAMVALEQARAAWERSQPQLQLWYGLVDRPTVSPGTGGHGGRRPIDQPSDGEPCGQPPPPADANAVVSSPSEHPRNETGGAGSPRQVSASTARRTEAT